MCCGDCLGVKKVTDEKNQGGGSAGTAAERLAKQRKALNLQTQPLEVIADLDWDVDDDDAEFTLPTPTPVSPKPKAAAAPARTSSGTMAMSAGDFAEAMKNEGIEADTSAAVAAAAKAEKAAADVATAAAEKAAAASEQTRTTAKQTTTRAQSSGGTMLLSGDAMKEAMEAAKIEAESTGAEHRETAPHTAVDRSAEPVAPQQSAGGTMLMSADKINEQLEEQVKEAQATAQSTDNISTGTIEDTTAPAHEPQTPDWDQQERPRRAAEWTDPDVSDEVSKSSGFLAGLEPNARVVLALIAVLALVIILWLIMR